MTTNAGSSRDSRGVRARRTGRKMWNSGSGDSDPWWSAFSAATAEVSGGRGEFGGDGVAMEKRAVFAGLSGFAALLASLTLAVWTGAEEECVCSALYGGGGCGGLAVSVCRSRDVRPVH